MKILSSILCLSLFAPSIAFSGVDEIKKSFKKIMPTLQLSSIEKSEIDGLYRVETDSGEVLFTASNGNFFITGDLYSIQGDKIDNLSEGRRGKSRAQKISSVTEEQKIVFPAEGKTKARISIFTDIDCGYCRKLHQEVPALNKMGVEVSYLAYPRAGIGSESYNKFVSAWCAADKMSAMTDAKNGVSIPDKKCDNPVASQFELGQQLGVSGTPAIVLEDGRLIPGYMTAQKLGAALGVL